MFKQKYILWAVLFGIGWYIGRKTMGTLPIVTVNPNSTGGEF